MRCPKCTQEGYQPYAACSQCGFSGAPGPVEELGHVAYLLGEIETWQEIGTTGRNLLRERYLRRRGRLEIDLGLRPPPLSAEDARQIQWEMFCLEELRRAATRWQAQGWTRPASIQRLSLSIWTKADALRQRLEEAGAGPAPAFDGVQDRLRLFDYLEEKVGQAHQRGYFVNDAAHTAVLAGLQAGRTDLEVQAGLRARPVEPVPIPAVEVPAPAPKPARPAKPAKPPREPITWERIWQTLLSERTLNVLLFLGAFLLVASAATYVIYNWETLPAAAQLAAILAFTASFYGAGWFLRVRMKLRASGIAVTAVGLVLVPLDFYAVFVAGGVLPREAWPWVWLAASALCLPLYTAVALRLRAGFLGYTVAAAAGSLLCAALRVLGVAPAWWLAALVALALGTLALAYQLAASPKAWSLFAGPFRLSALVAAAVTLMAGLGWWLATGRGGTDLTASLAGAWTLGTVLFAFGAAREDSPWLGRAAATALPLALAVASSLALQPWGGSIAWYGLAWALLAPLYLWAGHRWLGPAGLAGAEGEREGAPAGAPVRHTHGRTAVGWGLALMAVAAVWSVFDPQGTPLFSGWAAAATHAALAAGALLAVRLWAQPRALPVASLLALSASSFALAAIPVAPARLCLGWMALALLHILAALPLRKAAAYAAPLFGAGLLLAALAILPPLALADEPLLTFALGFWIALAAGLAWLDRRGKHPGPTALLDRFGPLRHSVLDWATALPLPFFAALAYTRLRAPDAWLGLLIAVLAWACVAGSWWLAAGRRSLPWSVVGYACSLAAPLIALSIYDRPLLAATVLLASGLYFASAWRSQVGWWFVPAGLALPLGLGILLDFWAVPRAPQSAILALLVAIYLLGGTWLARRPGVAGRTVAPLQTVGHLLAVVALAWGWLPAAESLLEGQAWPTSARLWAAAGQLILAVGYALFAWFRRKEGWAHAAAWLGVMAGAVIGTAYDGSSTLAFKAALLAAAYVLAERVLASASQRRWLPPAAGAWSLYRRPLLVAGWAVSALAVGLALVLNLGVLGGGLIAEVWAIAALVAVTVLYVFAAWLFRRRIFLWPAGVLAVVPWTLLTLWGWFLWPAPPPLPRYALSWVVLACLQLGTGLVLTLRAGSSSSPDYGFPLRAVAHGLLPVALLWGAVDPATSSLTWGLGAACYAASAVADHYRGLAGWRRARFLYPAVAVTPVWALYLLNRLAPAAPAEGYGLLLLTLALPLLAGGRLLRRLDREGGAALFRARSLPLYLGAYAVAIAGTCLVAPRQPWFAAALAFDALLCVLAAWLFRQPLWGYPAAALAPAALLTALAAVQVPVDRRGWWLIGLGAVYLALAWLLRRARLRDYALPPLALGLLVVALGLPPSSLDEVGAFWGYLAAALVYAAAAAWLRQPLLLAAPAALVSVPYGIGLVWLDVAPAHYGLALFPGVVAALALAHLLDRYLGRPEPILPAWNPGSWRPGGLLTWWAGPWYTWGYAGALLAVGLTLAFRAGQAVPDLLRLAAALALAAAVYLHGTWRFRSRLSLLLAGGLAQGAALALISAAGWLAYPAWSALAFLPVTMVTAALALAVERLRGEGSPLSAAGWSSTAHRGCIGWSRPLYLLLAADLTCQQVAALWSPEPGAIVTLAHALLLTLLTIVWVQPALPFVAAGLGIAGLIQGMAWAGFELLSYPVGFALLALGYGLVGYGLAYAQRDRRQAQIWRRPLEWAALGLSALALLWTALAFAVHLVEGTADLAPAMQTLTWVLALSGLLYLAAAVVRRWYVLGYGAVALLLASWALWWRFSLEMASFQWYAVPAGLYLLGVGWLECRQGRQTLARWIDRTGIVIWLGTAWWQSLPGVMLAGWPYALLLGAESLLLVWWGSARRHKQFLYAGAVAMVVNVLTQSIPPLLSANRWIVLGVAGALIMIMAVLVERNLNKIRVLSVQMRHRLEGWE